MSSLFTVAMTGPYAFLVWASLFGFFWVAALAGLAWILVVRYWRGYTRFQRGGLLLASVVIAAALALGASALCAGSLIRIMSN
jgi:hypothetical protein